MIICASYCWLLVVCMLLVSCVSARHNNHRKVLDWYYFCKSHFLWIWCNFFWVFGKTGLWVLRPGKRSCISLGTSCCICVGFIICFPRQPLDWFWKVQPWYVQSMRWKLSKELNMVSILSESKKGLRGATLYALPHQVPRGAAHPILVVINYFLS